MSHVGPEPNDPAGSDADKLEQALDASASEPDPPFQLPDDPEVPLADAWEGAQSAGDDDRDER